MATPPRIPMIPIALAALTVAAVPFLSWIPDDAYISFQYAQSLAEGDGLVFNAGEPVEGYSNLLWTLILAAVAAAGADIALWAPWLGLLCAGLAVTLFMYGVRNWLGAQQANDHRVLALIAVITGCYFPLAFYATSGLETPFYLLLLVIGVYCHLRARTDDRPRLHSVSIVALSLAALTRPEGLAFLLITAMVVVRVGDRSARLTAVLAVIAYAIVVLAKYDYYGTWLPNTYLAKPGLSLHYGAPIVRGLQYLARFLIKSGLILVVPIAVLRPKQPRARMVWKYLWTFVLVQLGFIVFVGGDVLRFDRFTVPMLPWILALAGLALRDRLPAGTALIRSRTGKAAVVVAVTVIALNVAQAIRANSKYCVHDWMHATAHRSVGRMVGQMAPDARAIVTNEIGAVRYYSRIPVIDMLGLTDATVSAIRFQSFQDHGIGSSAASVEAVCSYLLARRPDVILLPSTRRLNTEQRNVHRDTMHPLWYGLFAHERFVDDYEPAAVVRIRHDKFIYIFLRNDIPANTPAIPGPDQCFEVEPLS